MSITNITRDWGDVPCIVRILSTDTMATCLTAGYLTAQLPNTNLANNGVFEWLATDSVLVCASDGSALCTVSANFSSLVADTVSSVANGLTAHAGGGQANALLLTAALNRVTTVATAADSVKLPPALAKDEVVVINAAAANAMNVYPSSGDAINALSADTAMSVAANKTVIYFCAVNGTWNSVLTA